VNDPASDDPAFDDSAFDDPAFDGPAFDDLRALLAEARVVEPVPDDVAARLDATLASLRAEWAASAPVVPLRRRLGPILAAAAAVIVVVGGGFGITQTLHQSSGQDSRHATAADKASSADAGADAGGSTTGSAAAPVLAFTTSGFAREVAGLGAARLTGLPGTTATAGDSVSRAPAPTHGESPYEAAAPQGARSCAGPALPGTRSIPIILDGHPAALVVHPVSAGRELVEAWSCDGTERLASTTLPH
jgi:hypothetical protein